MWTAPVGIALLLNLAAPGRGQDVPQIAVLTIEVEEGVNAKMAKLLSNSVRAGVLDAVGNRDYRLLSLDTLEALMSKQGGKVCRDDACDAEMAANLGADYYLNGSVQRVGKKWMLTLNLHEARGTTRELASEVTPVDTVEDLVTAARVTARTVMRNGLDRGTARDAAVAPEAERPAKPAGTASGTGEVASPTVHALPSVGPVVEGIAPRKLGGLRVDGEPRGAQVSVSGPDGFQNAGVLPWEDRGLVSGKYRVEVTMEGHQPMSGDAVVAPGETAHLGVKLVRRDVARVAEGEFWMGMDAGEKDQRPRHKVYLGAFDMDRTEVTVEAFAACVKAGKCREPGTGGSCNGGKDGRGNHPVNCVDWNQASAFCAWSGKRLPTEAEWEKAARGADGRSYPWGETPPTCALAVMQGNGNDGCGKMSTWPVGSKPAGNSADGIADMAGNVWEWVSDWYGERSFLALPARNPAGPTRGTWRVLRGGSWGFSDSRMFTTSWRHFDDPTTRRGDIGFRCVRPVP